MAGTLTLQEVRGRVAGGITTDLGPTGWRESPLPYEAFGTREGKGRLHLGFAVGVPSTTFHDGRQSAASGLLVVTTVGVKWAYQVPAGDALDGYDAALTAEQALLEAILARAATVDLHLVYASSRRGIDEQGWINGEITVQAWHRLPLSS